MKRGNNELLVSGGSPTKGECESRDAKDVYVKKTMDNIDKMNVDEIKEVIFYYDSDAQLHSRCNH
ncbi:MAG: hypothetical protein FWD71_17025 [Oscillospiraceae bacterium]|nr:hypothetical protein [Oscillospiraceae bacterium]